MPISRGGVRETRATRETVWNFGREHDDRDKDSTRRYARLKSINAKPSTAPRPEPSSARGRLQANLPFDQREAARPEVNRSRNFLGDSIFPTFLQRRADTSEQLELLSLFHVFWDKQEAGIEKAMKDAVAHFCKNKALQPPPVSWTPPKVPSVVLRTVPGPFWEDFYRRKEQKGKEKYKRRFDDEQGVPRPKRSAPNERWSNTLSPRRGRLR